MKKQDQNLRNTSIDKVVDDPENWKIVATAENQCFTEIDRDHEGEENIWKPKLDGGFMNMDNWRLMNQP